MPLRLFELYIIVLLKEKIDIWEKLVNIIKQPNQYTYNLTINRNVII